MTGLRHLSGRVWLYPHDPDPDRVAPCVAVIACDTGSVLVDAGHSPSMARQVAAAIDDAGLPAPRTLVYTHHHWDHVWGACAWPGVEVVGHRSGARILEAEARRPWSHEYLWSEVATNPLLGPSFRARGWAMPSWDDFVIIAPHTEFEADLTLPDGIELRHVGGRHAEDSTVVFVPDSGVLLLGDSVYPPPYHLRKPDDGYDHELITWMLDGTAFSGVEWYVTSHSDPWSRPDLDAALVAELERRGSTD